MKSPLEIQATYWDRQAVAFDAIYSHRKSSAANVLDRIFRRDMYQRFNFALERGSPITDRSVLDAGCGSGRYAVAFAQSGASSVCGIDISQRMLQQAHCLAASAGVQDRCRFHLGDICAFDLVCQFDTVLAIGLLDYFRDPLPALRKIRSATIGQAIITFPRRFTWRALVRKVRLRLQGCDVFFYTRDSVGRLLHQAGFSRFTLWRIGQLYCAVAYADVRNNCSMEA